LDLDIYSDVALGLQQTAAKPFDELIAPKWKFVEVG